MFSSNKQIWNLKNMLYAKYMLYPAEGEGGTP